MQGKRAGRVPGWWCRLPWPRHGCSPALRAGRASVAHHEHGGLHEVISDAVALAPHLQACSTAQHGASHAVACMKRSVMRPCCHLMCKSAAEHWFASSPRGQACQRCAVFADQPLLDVELQSPRAEGLQPPHMHVPAPPLLSALPGPHLTAFNALLSLLRPDARPPSHRVQNGQQDADYNE